MKIRLMMNIEKGRIVRNEYFIIMDKGIRTGS